MSFSFPLSELHRRFSTSMEEYVEVKIEKNKIMENKEVTLSIGHCESHLDKRSRILTDIINIYKKQIIESEEKLKELPISKIGQNNKPENYLNNIVKNISKTPFFFRFFYLCFRSKKNDVESIKKEEFQEQQRINQLNRAQLLIPDAVQVCQSDAGKKSWKHLAIDAGLLPSEPTVVPESPLLTSKELNQKIDRLKKAERLASKELNHIDVFDLFGGEEKYNELPVINFERMGEEDECLYSRWEKLPPKGKYDFLSKNIAKLNLQMNDDVLPIMRFDGGFVVIDEVFDELKNTACDHGFFFYLDNKETDEKTWASSSVLPHTNGYWIKDGMVNTNYQEMITGLIEKVQHRAVVKKENIELSKNIYALFGRVGGGASNYPDIYWIKGGKINTEHEEVIQELIKKNHDNQDLDDLIKKIKYLINDQQFVIDTNPFFDLVGGETAYNECPYIDLSDVLKTEKYSKKGSLFNKLNSLSMDYSNSGSYLPKLTDPIMRFDEGFLVKKEIDIEGRPTTGVQFVFKDEKENWHTVGNL